MALDTNKMTTEALKAANPRSQSDRMATQNELDYRQKEEGELKKLIEQKTALLEEITARGVTTQVGRGVVNRGTQLGELDRQIQEKLKQYEIDNKGSDDAKTNKIITDAKTAINSKSDVVEKQVKDNSNAQLEQLVKKKQELAEKVKNEEGVTAQNMGQLSRSEIELKKVNQQIAALLPEYKQNNATALKDKNSEEAKVVAAAINKNPEANKVASASNNNSAGASTTTVVTTEKSKDKDNTNPQMNSKKLIDAVVTEQPQRNPTISTAELDNTMNNAEVLQIGSKGENVKFLQRMLGIKVDGDFGEQTAAAVKKFQEKNGYKVDGIVGAETHRGIYASVAVAGVDLTGVKLTNAVTGGDTVSSTQLQTLQDNTPKNNGKIVGV